MITTYLQSKLMTPASQPGQQGAQMTQAMNIYMPLLMGYLALFVRFRAVIIFHHQQRGIGDPIRLDGKSELAGFTARRGGSRKKIRRVIIGLD